MTNDLQKHLKNNPQIENVYINDNNEWQFHKREGYDTVLTRDEILDMDVSDETDELSNEVLFQTASGKVTKKAGRKAKVSDETNIEDTNPETE